MFRKWYETDKENHGIPATVRIEGKRRPVGMYLREKASKATGIPLMPAVIDYENMVEPDILKIRERQIIQRKEAREKSYGTPF